MTEELDEKKKLPAVVKPPVVEEDEEEEIDTTHVDAIEPIRKPIIKRQKFLSQSFSSLKPSEIEQSTNFIPSKNDDVSTFFTFKRNLI